MLWSINNFMMKNGLEYLKGRGKEVFTQRKTCSKFYQAIVREKL